MLSEPVLPALSVAEHDTVFAPTLNESTEPQDGRPATPERLSVALAVTVADPCNKTGFGVTDPDTTGFVLSNLNDPEAAGAEELPALSVQEPETVSPLPSGPE